MPRLRWSNDEIAQVVMQAVTIRRNEKELGRIDAIYRAQGQVIEEGRRKPELTHHFKKSLLARLEQAEKNPAYIHPQDPMKLIEPDPAPAPAPVEPPLFSMLREFGAALGAALAKELGPMLTAPIEAAIAKATAAKVNGAEHNGHNGHHALPAKYEIATKLPEKFVMHKIAVVGLLGSQQQTIKKSFPHLDFRWIEGGMKGDAVRNITSRCEAAFLMTKFMKHKTQDAVPRDKRVMVNGGVSDLTRLIEARFPRNFSMEPAQHH